MRYLGKTCLVATRAHKNPTRMHQLEKFSEEIAQRLATACPGCGISGWGPIDTITGLPCADRGAETELVRGVIWGCCRCPHKESIPLDQTLSEPQYCPPMEPMIIHFPIKFFSQSKRL